MDADTAGGADPADPGSDGAGSHGQLTASGPASPSAVRSADLARRFVEQLVAEAVVAGRVRDPGFADPPIDWQAIWSSADGVDSPERAAGRMVLAANRVAQTISGTPELVDRASVTGTGSLLDNPPPVATGAPTPSLVPPPHNAPPPPPPPAAPPPPSPPAPSPPAPAPPPPPRHAAPIPVPIPIPAPTVSAATSEPDDLPDAAGPSDSTGGTKKDRRRRRLSVGFVWVRNIGAVVILFAAWQLWGTALLQHHNQTQLAGQFHKDTGSTPADDRPFGLIAGTTRVVGPAAGSVIAQITIPAIGLSQYVVQGTSGADLEKGPGHYRGTAVPGQAGNVAIAGHRTTFGAPFGRLNELHPGESVVITTTRGEELTYVVSRTPTLVAPSDTAILDDAGDDRLTLSTSNPKYSAAQRLVVVAMLEQPSSNSTTTPPPPAGPPPGPLSDTQTSSWNWHDAPLAVLIGALLVLLGLAYRRPSRGRRLLTVLILGPIWIAGLALLFVAVTSVLPSTL